MPDERGRFHLAMSRRVELSLKQELDDVARKSVMEIEVNRDIQNNTDTQDDTIGLVYM